MHRRRLAVTRRSEIASRLVREMPWTCSKIWGTKQLRAHARTAVQCSGVIQQAIAPSNKVFAIEEMPVVIDQMTKKARQGCRARGCLLVNSSLLVAHVHWQLRSVPFCSQIICWWLGHPSSPAALAIAFVDETNAVTTANAGADATIARAMITIRSMVVSFHGCGHAP
jgi:hypothetical protein